MRILEIETAWQKSGVPERHRRRVEEWLAGGDGPSGSRWLEARSTIRGKLGIGSTIALIGPRGTGKTQLAVSAIRDVCLRGKTARYIRAIDLFRTVNECFGKTKERERKVVDGFADPALLVLDELHVRRETAAEGIVLTDLIDKRYGLCRDTLLLSNQTEPEFVENIGSSAHDRLIETGGLIVCDWESYRQVTK